MTLVGFEFGLASEIDELPNQPVWKTGLYAFLHNAIEWVVSLLSVIIAIFAVIRYRIGNSLLSGTIAVVFGSNAIVNTFYIFVTDVGVCFNTGYDKLYVDSVAWFISTIFYVGLQISGLGLLLYVKGNTVRKYLLLFAGFAVISTILAVSMMLFGVCKHARALLHVQPEDFLSKPFELIPLVLLIFPGIFVLYKYFRKEPSYFSHAMLLSVMPFMCMEIFTAFGNNFMYDHNFSLAHFYKLVLFMIPLLGILFDYIKMSQTEKITYQQLVDKEEELMVYTAQLKIKEDELMHKDEVLQAKDEELISKNENIALKNIELSESRLFFESTIDQSPLAILIIDAQTQTFIKLNDEARHMIGDNNFSTLEAFIDNQPVYYPDFTKYAVQDFPLYKSLLEGDKIVNTEFIITTQTGELRWVSVNSGPIVDHDGSIVAAILTMKDITVLRELQKAKERYISDLKVNEDKLTEQAKALEHKEDELIHLKQEFEYSKRDFIANVSHEVRTPLNAILGFADLLYKTDLTDTQLRYVNMFYEAGKHLLAIVEDILDFAKADKGEIVLEHDEFNIVTLVENIIDTYNLIATNHHIKLNLRIKSGVHKNVIGDKNRLGQILFTLIGNSLKFTDRGEILVTIEKYPVPDEPAYVLFSVTDTGAGIEEEKQKYIMDIFAQAENLMTSNFGTVGLGLAVCKKLIHIMGGDIWFESKANIGSSFYFTVRLEPTVSHDLFPSKLHSLPDTLSKSSVIILDEDYTSLLIMRDILTEHGVHVTSFNDADKALVDIHHLFQLHNKHYNVIFVSCRMNKGGFDFVKKLKTHYRSVKNVVMILPHDHRPNDLELVQGLDIAGYIVKPVKSQMLLDVLEAVSTGKRYVPPLNQDYSRVKILELPLKILLAEDNEMNQVIFTEYLLDKPYTIDVAENGAVAIEKFVTGHYDMIFMDMEMPLTDGYSATYKIRQWENKNNLKPTPIVALTAHALPEFKNRAFEIGCNDYLTKPIKETDLLHSIERNLDPAQYQQKEIGLRKDSEGRLPD